METCSSIPRFYKLPSFALVYSLVFSLAFAPEVATAAAAAATEKTVIIIGDSITQGWGGAGKKEWEKRFEPMDAINLGFSGLDLGAFFLATNDFGGHRQTGAEGFRVDEQ